MCRNHFRPFLSQMVVTGRRTTTTARTAFSKKGRSTDTKICLTSSRIVKILTKSTMLCSISCAVRAPARKIWMPKTKEWPSSFSSNQTPICWLRPPSIRISCVKKRSRFLIHRWRNRLVTQAYPNPYKWSDPSLIFQPKGMWTTASSIGRHACCRKSNRAEIRGRGLAGNIWGESSQLTL